MAAKVVNTEARVVLAVIMNIMIICSLAAWWTDEPPRMAPVIMPGMAMMPNTLLGVSRYVQDCQKSFTDLMLLIGGVKATLRACMTIGRHASVRDAPNARYISVLSLFSLYKMRQNINVIIKNLLYHIHQFFENVADGHDNARYSGATEHPHDWDYVLLSVASGGRFHK